MELWLIAKRGPTPLDPSVVATIEKSRGRTVAALKRKYRELIGEESRSSNKQFLFRRIAWHLQAKAEGDLSERARRRAAAIAEDRDLRSRSPQAFTSRPPRLWARVWARRDSGCQARTLLPRRFEAARSW